MCGFVDGCWVMWMDVGLCGWMGGYVDGCADGYGMEREIEMVNACMMNGEIMGISIQN